MMNDQLEALASEAVRDYDARIRAERSPRVKRLMRRDRDKCLAFARRVIAQRPFEIVAEHQDDEAIETVN
jgi:hypothetical protein